MGMFMFNTRSETSRTCLVAYLFVFLSFYFCLFVYLSVCLFVWTNTRSHLSSKQLVYFAEASSSLDSEETLMMVLLLHFCI